ncbi:stage V sporulation protein D, partial [Paenibacillus sp. MCAF20]
MFIALCVRLGYVQLWMGEKLASKAEDSWRRNIPYASKRGEIWDRNGVQLAYNISSPTVFAIPAQIKDRQAAATALAPLLDMSEETLYNKMKPGTMIVSLKPGGRKMTLDKAQQIRDLSIPGIVVAEDNKRYYPFGSLA